MGWVAGMMDVLFGTFQRAIRTIVVILVLMMLFSDSFQDAIIQRLQSLALA